MLGRKLAILMTNSYFTVYFVPSPDPNARLSLLTQPDWCYHMVNMPFNVYIPTLVLL